MKQKYLILFSLSGFIITLDQFTKQLVWLFFGDGHERELLPGLLNLKLIRNNGFVFGLLQRDPASLKDAVFIAVPVFAMVLIVLIFIKMRDNQMMTSIALTTILGGAIGNLIDRLQYGFVVDFIDFHLGSTLKFPPLNVADFCISLGVVLMFISTLKQRGPEASNVT